MNTHVWQESDTQLNMAGLYGVLQGQYIRFEGYVHRSVNENLCGAGTSDIKQNYIDCQL